MKRDPADHQRGPAQGPDDIANHANDPQRRNTHWSGGDWFSIPDAWVTPEVVGTLRLQELRVLLAIAQEVRFEQGLSHRGVESIQEVLGMDRRDVQRAMLSLRGKGLIELVRPGGGAKNPNVYRLKTPGETPGVPRSAKPRAKHPENRGEFPAKPRGVSRETAGGSPARSKDQREHSSKGAAAVGAMMAEGISEATAARLAKKLPALKARDVRKLAERTRRADNPSGLLIHLIEQDGGATIAARQRRHAREPTLAALMQGARAAANPPPRR